MQQHFYKTIFAAAGDVTAVPDPAAGDGSISYTEGYGFDYQRDPAADPAALRLSRQQFNQVLKSITDNLREYQIAGFPEFITAADNGGVPFPYPINAHVRFDTVGDGTGWLVYASTQNVNTTIPGAGGAHWVLAEPLSVASILASQMDVDIGLDDSGVVGPVELVRAAREGNWTFAGPVTYATAQALTVDLPGPGVYSQIAGAVAVFTVPALNTAATLTFKLGPNAAAPLRTSTGEELQINDLTPAGVYTAEFTGAEWRLKVPVASQLRLYGSAGSGAIFGLKPSNSAGALNTAIDTTVGSCRDTLNAVNITLTAPMTKRIDQPWAAGTGNGMRDTGAIAANQTWHLFVILNPVSGVVDILASQSATAPVLPAGFTVFRRYWSIMLDGASAIRQFFATGNYCEWKTPTNDFAATANAGVNVFTLRKVSVPNGIEVFAKFYFQSTDVGGAPDANAYISGIYDARLGPPNPLVAPNQWGQVRRGWFWAYPGAWNSYATVVCDQWTDNAQNIYTGSNDGFDVIAVKVLGYVDQRGQFF